MMIDDFHADGPYLAACKASALIAEKAENAAREDFERARATEESRHRRALLAIRDRYEARLESARIGHQNTIQREMAAARKRQGAFDD